MALSIDGTPVSVAGVAVSSKASASFTTSLTNDILIAVVANNRTNAQGSVATVTGITDNKSINTWAKRSQFSFQTGGSGTPYVDIEVWWCLAAAAQTGIIYTATFSATIDECSLTFFAVNGANTAAPWDTNASLPKTNNSTASAAPSVSGLSTDYDKTMLIMAVNAAATTNSFGTDQTAGSGFTIIKNQASSAGTNFSKSAAQQEIVSAVQSSISPAFGVSWPDWIVSADAIIASDAVIPGGGVLYTQLERGIRGLNRGLALGGYH